MVRENRFPGLPYIMLHSLSHMLMTSIALECGYPASSLRERVYAGGRRIRDPHLHGIVGLRRGRSEGWSRRDGASRSTLSAVSGTTCSARTDPVCAEHKPDAPHEARPLQGAACHGCLLIAETSCEQRNDFLDRALVIPTVGVRDAAFFASASLDP